MNLTRVVVVGLIALLNFACLAAGFLALRALILLNPIGVVSTALALAAVAVVMTRIARAPELRE